MHEPNIMNRDDLIQKWLDHNLNPQELEAFKQLDDYDKLVTLDLHLKGFKAETVDTETVLKSVWRTIHSKQKKSNRLFPLLSKIAAIFVICFGIYFYTTTLDTTTNTLVSQQKTIALPDASEVHLNSKSTITFNASQWDDNRSVSLDGEAFFKVATGKRFDVKTNLGTVTVLGTQFNVKHRNGYLEVTCYEGKVSVKTNTKKTTLLPGDNFFNY